MTMTRYIALALLVAGGFFTAGAALLPAPLFWPSAILAGVAAIVAVVVLVWGETRAAPRVRARARDDEEPVADQWTPEDIARLTASPDGADAFAFGALGFNRIPPRAPSTPEVDAVVDHLLRTGALRVERFHLADGTLAERHTFDPETAHESAVSGSSPAASAPDFTQEARFGVKIRSEALDAPPPRFVPDGQVRGAFVPNDGGWPPGRLVSVERFPEPITVGVDGLMQLARNWCLAWGEWAHDADPGCAKENAAEAALRAALTTALAQQPAACPKCGGAGEADSGGIMPWGAPAMILCECQQPAAAPVGVDMAAEGHDRSVTLTIPSRDERARAVRDVQQANRDAYWAARAEELAEQGGDYVRSLFAEVLDAGQPPPGAALARALELEQEIRTGKGGPLLLTDVGGRMDAGTAMAVIEQTRRVGAERAGQLVQIVAELSDEVSRLRGRVIGQIGMAVAGQQRANEEAIDPDEEDADRRQVESLSDDVLLDEALRRGLVRREE